MVQARKKVPFFITGGDKKERVHELFMRVKYTTPSYQLGMGEQKKKKKRKKELKIFF